MSIYESKTDYEEHLIKFLRDWNNNYKKFRDHVKGLEL